MNAKPSLQLLRWCTQNSHPIERSWEEKAPKFHSFKAEAIHSYATYPKGKKIFFPKRASLLLIRFHFLYYIYHICNFHQGKTNHSLTTFFQKCWETDEYIVLTHLLNMNSGRAGQIHKLFLCPAFKHVLALSDMGRTLPHSKKKHRLKSPVSQKQPWYVSLRELGGTAKSPRTLLNYSNASRQKQLGHNLTEGEKKSNNLKNK